MLKRKLEDRHPELDPWLYEVSFDVSGLGKPDAGTELDGLRTVHRINYNGQKLYRKWDCDGRLEYFCGAREKIASDLGQLLGVLVPPTLLWRDDSAYGCVQKEPPHYQSPLKLVDKAILLGCEGSEEIRDRIATAYMPENVFFDVWICNSDRSDNLANTLVAESSSGQLVWLIDFNCSFGHRERPWTERHKSESGFGQEQLPIPRTIWNHPKLLENLRRESDNIQGRLSHLVVDDVEEICVRAFGFYSSDSAEVQGASIVDYLNARKSQVKEWIWKALKL